MPILGSLFSAGAALAKQYGPQVLSALQRGGGGSPMYPGGPMGFAAPAGGGAIGPAKPGGFYHPHRGYTVAERQHWHGGRKRARRGLTASDIRGAQKVARLVSHFGYKPKVKARKRGRR